MLPLSSKERPSSSQLLNQPADHVIRPPATVGEADADDVRVDEGEGRRHRRALHERKVPAVLEHLQAEALLLLADGHRPVGPSGIVR